MNPAIVLGMAALAAVSASAAVPNGSFESVRDGRAEGWSAPETGAWCAHGGIGGGGAIALDGGKGLRWESEPAELAGDARYAFVFSAKGPATGLITAGPDFANVDSPAPGPSWSACTNVFRAPTRGATCRARFHLGEWRLNGRVLFDEAKLLPVVARWKRLEGGIELGGGESVEGNVYHFDSQFGGPGRNDARVLVANRCGFNTDRWTFAGKNEIVYRHALAGRQLLSASIAATCVNHVSGAVAVEASKDGTEWLPVLRVGADSSPRAAAPAELFPAEALWVRFRALPGCSLQIGGYGVEAKFDGEPLTAFGSSEYAEATTGATLAKIAGSVYFDEGYGARVPGGTDPAPAADLSGTWALTLNGADAGAVTLPGTLDENGKGKPNPVSEDTTSLARRFTFGGAAEYVRKFTVPPDWATRPLRLTLGLAHDATVFVDGRSAGTDKSISTPHVHTFGPLAPGEHTVAVRVTTPGDFPATVGGHAVDSNTQTDWNGILGKLTIEPVPPAEFRDVRVRTDAAGRRIVIVFSATGVPPGGSEIAVEARPRNFVGKTFRGKFPLAAGNRVEFALGPEAALWDEFHPNLYTLSLSAEGFATYETTVGLRDFTAEGHRFAVNGRPVFLRGRHDAGVFPLTAHQPTDLDSWRKHLGTAKAWGLNYVRFHSWCPCEAAFEAADELGLYLQPELPFWGWSGIPDGEDNPLADYLAEEGRRILDAYGNHPSFVQFALGNEIDGNRENLEKLAAKLREHDAVDGRRRRLMTDGSNNYLGKRGWTDWMDYFTTCRMGKEAWGSTDTHVRASFSFADADQGGILATADPNGEMTFDAAVGACPIPVIGHETGQYQAYPDFGEIAKYTGVLRPDNLNVFRRRLAAAGLADWDERFHRDSGRWAAELYKADVEMNLRSAKMAGFQLLDLQDYPGQGTALVGVLDAFMEPKGQIDRQTWRGFCSETVPLARLAKFTFADGEKTSIGLSVCDYSENGIAGTRMDWRLARADAGGEAPVACGSVPIAAPGRGLKDLGSVPFAFALRDGGRAERLTLTLTLENGVRNTYPIWVYPARESGGNEPGLLVTASLDAEAERVLAAGGRVLWTPSFSSIANRSVGGLALTDYWNYRMFKTVSENLGREVSPGTLGLTLDPSHPLFGNFPTESHASWQWARILRASRPLILDGIAAEVPVRVIDNVERNHSLALVAGWSVGHGRLLVCATDFSSPLVANPEGRAWRAAVTRYAASEAFRPTASTTLATLRRHFATASGETAPEALDNKSNYAD